MIAFFDFVSQHQAWAWGLLLGPLFIVMSRGYVIDARRQAAGKPSAYTTYVLFGLVPGINILVAVMAIVATVLELQETQRARQRHHRLSRPADFQRDLRRVVDECDQSRPHR
jgi:hypothetical protein